MSYFHFQSDILMTLNCNLPLLPATAVHKRTEITINFIFPSNRTPFLFPMSSFVGLLDGDLNPNRHTQSRPAPDGSAWCIQGCS